MGYGAVSSLALDPIEKKPLYRFYPGSTIVSLGGFGCNLRCPFCQNCEISHEYDHDLNDVRTLSPDEVVALAKQTVANDNIGVAYTYNEPLVGYEFVSDCARLVHQAGLKNVLVTNGYIDHDPLVELLPVIDAMNIDLKGFSERFYRKLGGSLTPVKEAIELAYTTCHLEVTTLVIPDENDSAEEMEALSSWLGALDPSIPLHLSRFFPRYRYADREPTPLGTLSDLRKIAQEHLQYVSVGNV